MAFPRPIRPNNNIQPLAKLKIGIGKNSEIPEMEAL